jgi:hypothetical protein
MLGAVHPAAEQEKKNNLVGSSFKIAQKNSNSNKK